MHEFVLNGARLEAHVAETDLVRTPEVADAAAALAVVFYQYVVRILLFVALAIDELETLLVVDDERVLECAYGVLNQQSTKCIVVFGYFVCYLIRWPTLTDDGALCALRLVARQREQQN